MTITHTKVSAVADGGDATLVRPSDWNANHSVVDIIINSPAHNFSNLIAKSNVTNPTYQIDIDADAGKLSKTTGEPIIVSAINLTIDITAAGANGLDTGAEAGSTWYHIWVISNGSVTAGLLSLSATAPSMPSGYTYKAYVGAIYNNASSNFLTFYQLGGKVRCLSGNVASLTSTSAASINLAALVPTTAKFLYGITLNATASAIYFHPITFTPGDGAAFWISSEATAGSRFAMICPLETAQQIYYAVGAGSLTLYISGWEY